MPWFKPHLCGYILHWAFIQHHGTYSLAIFCCFRPCIVWVCELNPSVGSILSLVKPVYILMQNICKICCNILPPASLFLLWSPPFCVQLWSLFSIVVCGDVVLCFCCSDDFLQMILDHLQDNGWIWKIFLGFIGFSVLSSYIISKLKAKPVTEKSKKSK
jgi:hypothetical protein